MGWFKKLGKNLKNNIQDLQGVAIESLRTGAAEGIINALYPKTQPPSPDSITDLSFVELNNVKNNAEDLYIHDTINYKVKRQKLGGKNEGAEVWSDYQDKESDNLRRLNKMSTSNTDREYKKYVTSSMIDDRYNFYIPDWGIDDFINERILFRKGISTITNDPGWFYFKIFFDFDSQQGLLGGLLNNKNILHSTNTAGKFLKMSDNLYHYHKLNERYESLKKFAGILSFITSSAPWFFIGMKGLDQASILRTTDITKERSFEILCDNDALDMRLTTMLDLYKFAAFDSINNKEIIPENLRKFNMSVVVFESPVYRLHSAMKSKTMNMTFPFKKLYGQDNIISYKIYNFINCEISQDSLGSTVPGDLSNTTAFQLGKNAIKITYDNVFEHTSNEFFGILFGSDGYYIDDAKKIGQEKRYEAMRHNIEQAMTGCGFDKTKEIIEASEEIAGDIYENQPSFITQLGANYLLRALHTSYSAMNPLGNIYGNVGRGSQFQRDRAAGRNGHTSAVTAHRVMNNVSSFNMKDFLLQKQRKRFSQM